MNLRLTPIALAAALLGTAAAAQAQQPAPKAPARQAAKEAAPEPIAKVEIKGSAEEYDARRDDTASKTVMNHEEIIKYGDTNVFDVLKRAPGVTVIGNAIRMRGLGNGYTQIMVNGERPPPGFTMDTLAPDQIERIEVVRAATAEHSMQAIAGSINIILKKVVSKPQRDVRINTAYSEQQRNLFVNGTLADRDGRLSWYLNGVASRFLGKNPSDSTEQFSAPSGQVVQLRDKATRQSNDSASVGLSPRLNWKLDDDGQFNLSSYIQSQRFNWGSDTLTANRVGSFPVPDYVERNSEGRNRSSYGNFDVNWVVKLAGGKLDAKANMGRANTDSAYHSLSYTADRQTVLLRDTSSESQFTHSGTTGKYTRTMFDGHALSTGWEASRQGSDDSNHRVEGVVGLAPNRIDEAFNPVVTKVAVYAQDEWNVSKDWSVYLGARWETINTDSAGTGLQTTESRNRVLSPVAQTLYKFPDKSGRQLRLALTRTFKAPNTGQLTARRYEADLNTRFTPDSSGNPDLKPELATGVDLTYEHFFAPGAVFSVGTSQRRISDYIRSRLGQDARGYWLVQPVNDGNATVRSLDVELKFPLKAIMKDAPGFDFRASANRNWSKVDSVPGPDNRLDQQIPLTMVLGTDYREDKYSAGASLSYRQGGAVRISEQQSSRLQGRRELEGYLLYKIRTGYQLRLAVSNALGEDNLSDSQYLDSNGGSRTWTRSPGSARYQANLEMKF
ncbi:TonB-dependent receptor plug domain-containing protein [Pseudoduganella sp. UC29_71]|uniref:TonB-dependent receptor plug domain-containing protein n=1 Tax=Pseudoduganella sp. UC29_71 TaxID=3350174 RepID=UPI0036703B95